MVAISTPGAAVLADMTLEIGAEVLERALKRLGGAGRERAECVTGLPHPGQRQELLDLARLPAAFLHRLQNPLRPPEAAPAGRAKTARLLSEEVCQVPRHANRAGLIVEHDHGAGAQAAADFLECAEIHRRVQVLLDDEIGRGPPRQKAAKPKCG